jgi:hypothetical protein
LSVASGNPTSGNGTAPRRQGRVILAKAGIQEDGLSGDFHLDGADQTLDELIGERPLDKLVTRRYSLQQSNMGCDAPRPAEIRDRAAAGQLKGIASGDRTH